MIRIERPLPYLAGVVLILVSTPGCEELEEGDPGESCVVLQVTGPATTNEAECSGHDDPVVRWQPFDDGDLSPIATPSGTGLQGGAEPGCRWGPRAVRVDKGSYRVILDSFGLPAAPPWTTSCQVAITQGCFHDALPGELHELTFFYGLEGCCFDGEPEGMPPAAPGAIGCPPAPPGLAQPPCEHDGGPCSDDGACCSGVCENAVCVAG